MKLYDYDEALDNCLNQDTGEFDEEKFTQLAMERDNKIEGLLLWIKDLKASASAIGAEIKTLTERKRVCENRAESIKEFLTNYLNGDKFATARVSVSYRADKSVQIDDIFQIPEEFLKYSEPTADKIALKKALQEEGDIPGCHIEEKRNMIIK